jgi:hypothetical protein
MKILALWLLIVLTSSCTIAEYKQEHKLALRISEGYQASKKAQAASLAMKIKHKNPL